MMLPWGLTAFWFTTMACLVWTCLRLADGHLIYVLDDPYIHLAVAESILEGGYGVNTGEHAAPSSSILYPFLLAVGEAAGLGAWTPLALNVFAMAATVFWVGRIVDESLSVGASARMPVWLDVSSRWSIAVALCCVMHAWGLPMTGLEHPLHLWLVACSAWVLIRRVNGQAWPVWMPVLIALLPLVRFEGLALSALLCVALAGSGAWRLCAGAVCLLVAELAWWHGFTQAQGLPFFPASVLLKSAVTSAAVAHDARGLAWALAGKLVKSLGAPNGWVLCLGSLGLLAWGARAGLAGRPASFWLAVCAGGAGLAHVLLGEFGGYTRYEVHAMVLVALSWVFVMRARLGTWPSRLACVLVLLFAARPQLADTWITPAASRNIHEQQHQMHRFVTEFHPVPSAVNDLGWVAYRNPQPVLDLVGLGSEEVRVLRMSRRYDQAAISRLVHERGVRLVMVYEGSFGPVLPTNWSRVAELKTSWVVVGGDRVAFFVPDAADVPLVQARLCRFRDTLPRGAWLTMDVSLSDCDTHRMRHPDLR